MTSCNKKGPTKCYIEKVKLTVIVDLQAKNLNLCFAFSFALSVGATFSPVMGAFLIYVSNLCFCSLVFR